MVGLLILMFIFFFLVDQSQTTYQDIFDMFIEVKLDIRVEDIYMTNTIFSWGR